MLRSPRLWIAIAAGIASASLITFLAGGAGATAGRSMAVRAAIEPLTYPVVSSTGGIVREVAVRAGDPVQQGQLLLRLDAREWAKQRQELEATATALEAALKQRDTLFKLPAQARAFLQESHPDVVRAETQYVQALADFENAAEDKRGAAKLRLDAAAEARVGVRRRISNALPSGTKDLQQLLASVKTRVVQMEKAQDSERVYATSAGVVDILDLHIGDRILPGHPVALLITEGEYFAELVLKESDAVRVHAGMRLKGSFVKSGATFSWLVDSISPRTIPLVLRESRQVSEESVLRARISLREVVIAPGTLADFQLP